MFGSAFALSDLFSGSSDIAAAPSPFDESLWDTSDKSLLDFSDESLFGVVDESLFNVPDESLGDVSNESLSDPDILLSFCSNDGTGQPSKLRARDVVCPSNLLAPPTLQLEAPELPTITDIENAVTKKPQKDGPDRTVIKIISVNGLDMRTDDPKYYCAKFAEPSYTIPVCGSGSLMDRIDKMPPYYARIENSIKLGQSIFHQLLSNSVTRKNLKRNPSCSSIQVLDVRRIRVFLLCAMDPVSGWSFFQVS